jgi:hypothetical protein
MKFACAHLPLLFELLQLSDGSVELHALDLRGQLLSIRVVELVVGDHALRSLHQTGLDGGVVHLSRACAHAPRREAEPAQSSRRHIEHTNSTRPLPLTHTAVAAASVVARL